MKWKSIKKDDCYNHFVGPWVFFTKHWDWWSKNLNQSQSEYFVKSSTLVAYKYVYVFIIHYAYIYMCVYIGRRVGNRWYQMLLFLFLLFFGFVICDPNRCGCCALVEIFYTSHQINMRFNSGRWSGSLLKQQKHWQ